MISKEPKITVNDLAELLNLTRRTVLRELKQLRIQNRINRRTKQTQNAKRHNAVTFK